MSDAANQPSDKPGRVHAAEGRRRATNRRIKQAIAPISQPEQVSVDASPPPQAVTDDIAFAQPAQLTEASSPAETSAASIGEQHWGEFPPPERQAELAQHLQTWDQKRNHGKRPGPFAGFLLTGSDVYWLASFVAGEGDIDAGKKKLAEPSFVDLSHLHLEGADLFKAQLEGAKLRGAQLQGARLQEALLNGAYLYKTQLRGANLYKAKLYGAFLNESELQDAFLNGAELQVAKLDKAQLQEADLYKVQLQGATLQGAQLQRSSLIGAQLVGANLSKAELQGASLHSAQLQEATLYKAQLEGAILYRTQLQKANLTLAQLEGATLNEAQLQGAVLQGAQLAKADLSEAQLSGADLRKATFDGRTDLTNVHFDHMLRAADAAWNNVSLIRMKWGQQLGDEVEAHQKTTREITGEERPKTRQERLENYEAAIRAYRQLAIALRNQGLNEAADRFAYRALVLQRELLWLEIGLPMPGFKQFLTHLKMLTLSQLWQGLVQGQQKPKSRRPPSARLRWRRARHLWKHSQHTLQRLNILQPKNWFACLWHLPAWMLGIILILLVLAVVMSVMYWWWGPLALLTLALLGGGLRLRRGRKASAYLFSAFLAVLTGYGFQMKRIVIAYLLLICIFATAYWSVGINHPHDISFWTAIIISVTAFHGRVFTNPFTPNLPDAQVIITAIEAIVGLVIEGVFIAMLTQRFFNR